MYAPLPRNFFSIQLYIYKLKCLVKNPFGLYRSLETFVVCQLKFFIVNPLVEKKKKKFIHLHFSFFCYKFHFFFEFCTQRPFTIIRKKIWFSLKYSSSFGSINHIFIATFILCTFKD